MDAAIRIERLAGPDVEAMRALNDVFAAAFGARDYDEAPPDDAYLGKVLAKDDVIVLVARQGTAVVGGLVAYVLDKLEQARAEVYLYDLAVRESHRRRGVATGLIERLGVLARERGAWVVFVQADYGDDPAIALYDKLGAREAVLHFDLPLPEPPRRP